MWFVFSTEDSEMVFWREKSESNMSNPSSVVLWWSPLLMIRSIASEGRSLLPIYQASCTSSMYHVNHTLRSMPLLAMEDSYFLGSCSVLTVVLRARESNSF